MDAALNAQKTALRKQIRAAVQSISTERRMEASRQICTQLKEQPFWKKASAILFFAPLPDEIDLWPLLEEALTEAKVVALPCFDSEKESYTSRHVKNIQVEIISGQFGIREPAPSCIEIPLDDLDLILVPGIAFDLRGNRLGRGKGFYDRLLPETRKLKCGIAFDEQIVAEIPAGTLDVPMDFILTPTRYVRVAD
ncbi:MAG: 5-formyltetrahydrofolate cyclo-ligase [Limisphaerales bacterium]